MLLTIVTVCKNEANRIEKTLKSVLKSEETDFEYIIMDGGSQDETLNIISSYKESFSGRGITYRVISKADHGIYNAMNNALDYASGDWIIYLNAGDLLVTKRLSEIVSSCDSGHIDIIYGDVVMIENGYYKRIKAKNYNNLLFEMPMCHQGVLCKTDLVRKYGFREEYRLAADYDFLLRALKGGTGFKYVNTVIAVYPLDGMSTKNAWKYQLELMQSGKQVNGFSILYQTKALTRSIVRIGKKWGAALLPKQYHVAKRGWKQLRASK